MRKAIVSLTLLLGLAAVAPGQEPQPEPLKQFPRVRESLGLREGPKKDESPKKDERRKKNERPKQDESCKKEDLGSGEDPHHSDDPYAIRGLAERLFARPGRREGRQHFSGRAGAFGCDEPGQSRLFRALDQWGGEKDNEHLAAELDAHVARLLPRLLDEETCGSNFVVRYDRVRESTEKTEPAVKARFVACRFEQAWKVLCQAGDDGGAGFDCPLDLPLVVNLVDLDEGTFGGTSSHGPIFINTTEVERALHTEPARVLAWVSHELFHNIQYEYCFRSKWEMEAIAEGTAAWAETHVVRSLRDPEVVGALADEDLWKREPAISKPSIPFWERDYDALPFIRALGKDSPVRIREILEVFRDEGGIGGLISRVTPDVAATALFGFSSERFESSECCKQFGGGGCAESEGGRPDQPAESTRESLWCSRLDPSRSYLRPYRVKVNCDDRTGFEHEGNVLPLAADYYQFIGSAELSISVVAKVGDEGDVRCLADVEDDRVDLTVIGIPGKGERPKEARGYTLVVSCGRDMSEEPGATCRDSYIVTEESSRPFLPTTF